MSKILFLLALVFILFFPSGDVFAQSLAEDPTVINEGVQSIKGKPWVGKSPDELRGWAKKNLHHKLTGKRVISDQENPQWAWFRKSGLGIFLHWGLASLPPANGDAWAMVYNERRAKQGLMRLPESMFAAAEGWNPENYEPQKWMKSAKEAGFGYAVLTTRHHDGYCLWPSEHGDWDTGEKMGGRDLVKQYVEACRAHGLRVGLYYSGPNWHFSYKLKDFSYPPSGINYLHQKVGLEAGLTPLMGRGKLPPELAKQERSQSKGQVVELLTKFGDIDMLWWDGNSIMTEQQVHEIQPNTFVARGNIATPEGPSHGKSTNVKVTNEAGWWWELCRKPERKHTPNWHYNKINEDASNHWNTNEILTELIRCRALGGNLLINITPRPDGSMMDWYYRSCTEMADWMKHSKEAIYDVRLDAPLPMLDRTENYTTVAKDGTYYCLPNVDGEILITDISAPISVTLLRTGEALSHQYKDGTFTLKLSDKHKTELPDLVKLAF